MLTALRCRINLWKKNEMNVKSNLNPKRQTFYANYWSVKAIQSPNNPLSVHRSWPEALTGVFGDTNHSRICIFVLHRWL